MSVDFLNTSSLPVYVGVLFRPITGEDRLSSWRAWRTIEGNGWIHKMCMLSPADQVGAKRRLSIKAPLWKVWGNKKEYYGTVGFASTTDTNPAVQIEGIIYTIMPVDNGAPSQIDIYTKIRLTVYVKFFGRRFLETTTLGGAETEDVVSNLNTGVHLTNSDNVGPDIT